MQRRITYLLFMCTSSSFFIVWWWFLFLDLFHIPPYYCHAWIVLNPTTKNTGIHSIIIRTRTPTFPSSVSLFLSSSSSSNKQGKNNDNHDDNDDNNQNDNEKNQNDINNKNNDTDSIVSGIGMEQAFQQLERLSVLLDDDDTNNDNNNSTRMEWNLNTTTNNETKMKKQLTSSLVPPIVTPEQEMELYKNMVQELEQTTEEDLYSTVLQDMGGSSSSSNSNTGKKTSGTTTNTNSTTTTTSGELLNQALTEALQQVQVNQPSVVDSLLEDPVFLNEIEAIFERGNAQLLEGLEEVRREQEQLTQASIVQAQKRDEQEEQETQERLEVAERSMQTMLQRVQQERNNVEKAVQELQRVQQEQQNQNGNLLRLKQNPFQQTALIGFLLFAFRSLTESFAALSSTSSGDPTTQWTSALIQGGIAIVCAIVFYLLK